MILLQYIHFYDQQDYLLLTTPFYELTSVIHDGKPFTTNDGISSATSAYKTPHDFYYDDIAGNNYPATVTKTSPSYTSSSS